MDLSFGSVTNEVMIDFHPKNAPRFRIRCVWQIGSIRKMEPSESNYPRYKAPKEQSIYDFTELLHIDHGDVFSLLLTVNFQPSIFN